MTLTFNYDEYPVILDSVDHVSVLVCSSCGRPVGSGRMNDNRKGWHCYHCQKWKKGGVTDDVQWVITMRKEDGT